LLTGTQQSSKATTESGTKQNRYHICMTDMPEIAARFQELIYGTGFWHVCHGPKNARIGRTGQFFLGGGAEPSLLEIYISTAPEKTAYLT